MPRNSPSELFSPLSLNAERGHRAERLILRRYIEKEATRHDLQEDAEAAHAIILRWADLESSGKLQAIKETQLQGDFLREVFGDALGYTRRTEGAPDWHLEQHRAYANCTPDAVIGKFSQAGGQPPLAVIELKGPKVHLDRDRSSGRTAVQQCWDYLNHLPETPWGIVSNIVSFRLYHREHTPRRYEHFALQDLRDIRNFRRFYVLFSRRAIIADIAKKEPIAIKLLTSTEKRQRTVGTELYDNYSRERTRLIDHLYREHTLSVEQSVAAAQRLMDRIIFIAFCEDRELLPERLLKSVHATDRPFSTVTNPKWQAFLDLFRAIDKGSTRGDIPPYNGGLFAQSFVDDLNLDDRWTNFFPQLGEYDFADEVNLDVLGHIFERSITELEKLKEGDLFGGTPGQDRYAEMPKSAQRKRFGVYYTPPDFTRAIAENTIDDLLTYRFAEHARRHKLKPESADTLEYWRDCLETLLRLRVLDPACGSGAFLFQAYEILEARYLEVLGRLDRLGDKDAAQRIPEVPEIILRNNIYAVDLSPEAVEIAQLALWIRTARRGSTLADLSHNIRHGNSLVDQPDAHPDAFDWREHFPEVFDGSPNEGFDCIIGNPPWERLKLQEREFFSLSAPKIATESNAAKRERLVNALEKQNPELFARYLHAKANADAALSFARNSDRFPLTGRGDINTYALFAELALELVSPMGRVGLLVPSGIASDNTTKDFFAALADSKRLRALYDFENRSRIFPDVDGRFKFSILLFGGREHTSEQADFVFFARDIEELSDQSRHIALSAADIALVNPNTRTCPIFRSNRDARLTRRIYESVPVLIRKDREPHTNEWGVRFQTMFHQTNDAANFIEPEQLRSDGFRLRGNRFIKGKQTYLPLYEGKMIQAYDHRAGDVVSASHNWVRQNQTEQTTNAQHSDLNHLPVPRWWVSESLVIELLRQSDVRSLLAFKDVTSPTNSRTMIASFLPKAGVLNSAPIMAFGDDVEHRLQACLLGNLNSFVYDFVARQKVGGVHLNYFIVEQLPTLPPHRYAEKCPWARRTTLRHWISERVLKLSCTAIDMLPLAEAADFKSGNAEDGRLHRWGEQERADIMAELDAAYFLLYNIEREDAEYILSTFNIANEIVSALPGARTTAERILDAYDHILSLH